MITEITSRTVIDKGLQISGNLLLDHLTNGAWHHKLGEFVPRFSSKLIPSNYNNLMTTNGLPIWKIAKALQIGSNSILERMMSEFGSDLIIRSGFLNNIPAGLGKNEIMHTIGKGFDISVKGFEDNMYPLAKDIQKIATKASNLQMVFGDTSWIHIDFDLKKANSNSVKEELPNITSFDSTLGVLEKGISALRGVL